MKLNLTLWIYKFALSICAFLLANFFIDSEQLKAVISYCNKKGFNAFHKAKEYLHHPFLIFAFAIAAL